MKKKIFTLDGFCGGGGVSSGMKKAVEELGLEQIGVAINHWETAVLTMRKNHPKLNTLRMSMESAEPTELFPGRVINLAWFSPSCTHHSRAKGGQPRQDQSRCQPHTIIPFIDQCDVHRIIVENVPEFKDWGPLDGNGTPIKSKKGLYFLKWVEEFQIRGYKTEWRIVKCADYGDATTRERFFFKAVKSGHGEIAWPEPTHSEHPQKDLFGKKLKPWRGIRDCIDFSNIGHSIFNRKKPLAANTMRRIAIGMQKYCGIDLNPFLVKLRHSETAASVDRPISTITAGGTHFALCQPFIVKAKRNQAAENIDKPISAVCAHTVHHALCQAFVLDHTRNGKAKKLDSPIPSQTTKAHMSMITPLVLGQQGGAECHSANKPCPTVATAGAIRVIMPFVVDNANGGIVRGANEPVNTVTVKDQHMGVFPMLEDGRIIDIYIRMLEPKELAAAHSFPEGYVFCGTKTDQYKQIGNSVPVNTAKAMCEADLRQIAKGK